MRFGKPCWTKIIVVSNEVNLFNVSYFTRFFNTLNENLCVLIDSESDNDPYWKVSFPIGSFMILERTKLNGGLWVIVLTVYLSRKVCEIIHPMRFDVNPKGTWQQRQQQRFSLFSFFKKSSFHVLMFIFMS